MIPADAIPEGSNFFGSLVTSLSKGEIAQLYGAAGWTVRKCSWVDFEIRCAWAELIIDGDSPILLHGSVADVLVNADRILEPLVKAGIAHTAECYGEDEVLLKEYAWSATDGA
jgi:hypothetical protein